MEKRMIKNWYKLTGLRGVIPSEVFIERELTRGQMRSWMLSREDREDYLEWMPVDIAEIGPKVLVTYTNVVSDTNTVSDTSRHLTLAIYEDRGEITEWVGNEFTVTPLKKKLH
jgi:hypothetical protein